jgi:hypothetical protein
MLNGLYDRLTLALPLRDTKPRHVARGNQLPVIFWLTLHRHDRRTLLWPLSARVGSRSLPLSDWLLLLPPPLNASLTESTKSLNHDISHLTS